MTCEIVNSAFDEEWLKASEQHGGLDAIAEFNAAYNEVTADDTIDPNLTLSNPTTPRQNDGFQFDNVKVRSEQSFPTEQVYDVYPHPSHATPSSPYFQSVELSQSPMYQHSPLRNEQFGHRRSVSEPPGMSDQPQMMFHREAHFLGPPLRDAIRLKSLPKKHARNHPYLARTAPRKHNTTNAMEEHGANAGIERFQTQSQQLRAHPPTSVPMMQPYVSVPRSYIPSNARVTLPEQMFMVPASSSRVCTPTPATSPPVIDPALSQPQTPIGHEKRATLSIPITVSELEKLIERAVKKAVGTGEYEEEQQQQPRASGSDGESITPKLMQTEEAGRGGSDIPLLTDE
jgi:hypothetical protein